MSTSRQVSQAIARFDEVMGRIDRGTAARDATARQVSRGALAIGRKVANIAIASAVILVGALVAGLVLNGIGLTGLFIVFSLLLIAVITFSMWPSERPIVEYKEDMPNHAVVQRLSSLLDRKRAALPAPATRSIDAIHQQLPLLESRLSETSQLDPLAQDARRLMGKHLPELIERYERVPAAYRSERDGEGLTVDQRLVQGIEAARSALDDLGRRLAREDLNAFETQGRFIESRYKDGGEMAPPQ
jgi:hypothetical protein